MGAWHREGRQAISSQGSGLWFQLPPLDLVFLPPSLFPALVIIKQENNSGRAFWFMTNNCPNLLDTCHVLGILPQLSLTFMVLLWARDFILSILQRGKLRRREERASLLQASEPEGSSFDMA